MRLASPAPLQRALHGRNAGLRLVTALTLALLLMVAMWSSTHFELDADHTEHAAHAAVTAISVLHEPGPAHDSEAGVVIADAAPTAPGLCFLGVLCGMLFLVFALVWRARCLPLAPVAHPPGAPPVFSALDETPPPPSLTELAVSRT